MLAICALVLSSCSIVRGLTTDGKYGPNIFSFEKREVDTIANGEYTFQFPIGKRADYLSERVWKPLGMEHPALINIDSRKEISIPNAPTRMNCLIPQRST